MSRTNDSEWPKEWSEIMPDRDDDQEFYINSDKSWVNIGLEARAYEGTFYVTPTFGNPDESEKVWMPFNSFVRQQIQKESEQLNEEFASEVIKNVD